MTKIKATATKLNLKETKVKVSYKKFCLPVSCHPSVEGEFHQLITSLQKSGHFKESMLGSIESYLNALYMQRQAASAVARFGLIDDKGCRTQAAELLARSIPLVKSLAAHLGLTTLAMQAGTKKDPESNVTPPDEKPTTSSNPWAAALNGDYEE